MNMKTTFTTNIDVAKQFVRTLTSEHTDFQIGDTVLVSKDGCVPMVVVKREWSRAFEPQTNHSIRDLEIELGQAKHFQSISEFEKHIVNLGYSKYG